MTDTQTAEVDDIGADIAAAMTEIESAAPERQESVEPTNEPVQENESQQGDRDEKGRFVSKEKPVEVAPAIAPKTPPAAWVPHQEKFLTLPPEIQELIRQREEDVNKGFTKFDEERNFGKALKEVITPYMAQIRAEGGDAPKAVQSLLDTAYRLRTADPVTKAHMVASIIQQYGVDMRYAPQGPQSPPLDPRLNSVIQEVSSVKQLLAQQQSLQQQHESANIQKEYQAFSAKPENAHVNHPEVKAAMASLLESGRAQGYQDAYDAAIWTVPEVRSTLISQQTATIDAKRKEELAAKKNAGSSVTGSPGLTVPNSGPATNPNSTVDEDIRAAMAQHGFK